MWCFFFQLEEELSGVVEIIGMVSNKGVVMAYTYNILREDKGIPFGGFFVVVLFFWLWHWFVLTGLIVACVCVSQTWSCTTRRWKSFTTSLSTTPSRWLPVDEARTHIINIIFHFFVYCLLSVWRCAIFLVNKKCSIHAGKMFLIGR